MKENGNNIFKETYLQKERPIMDLFSLEGKTAIVTGGINGLLGPIWMDTLSAAGARTIPLDLPGFDVTQNSIILDSPIDILVNNAAIDNPPDSKASFFGNFNRIMEVNIGGAARMAEQVIPNMIKNGGGVIVNVGSIQGNIGADWRNYPEGFEKPVAYNCSKAALIQLSRSITTQYGRYRIRSVTISFGPYDSAKLSEDFKDKFLKNIPLGKTISKESLQMTLLFACCCPELAGIQILVDGGYCAW